MPRLRDQLREAGCTLDESTFKTLVSQTFKTLSLGMTSEELLHHPDRARRFARGVANQTGLARKHEPLILRTLTNLRKRCGLDD